MSDNHKAECQHEYKRTLAKSGMFFISMCHKCKDEKPYNDHKDLDNTITTNKGEEHEHE